MKRLAFILSFIFFYGFSQENDKVNYLGDNFSLEAALASFKSSETVEEFEKNINSEKSNVTNLDLNEDGDIDYIHVEDVVEGNTHVFILSTFLNEKEKQDIAIIAVEKNGENSAIIQIEGNEDLFPENTIVEPFDIKESADKNSKGPAIENLTVQSVIINVWSWPLIKYIYSPRYVVWVSPYRWANYPRWWKPWKPLRYSIFYSRCNVHRVHYRKTNTVRVITARRVYSPRRSSTVIVRNKRGTTIIKKNRTNRTTKRRSRR